MPDFKRLTISRAASTDAASATTPSISAAAGEFLRVRTVSRVGEPKLTLTITANGIATTVDVDLVDVWALGAVAASDAITLTATLNTGEAIDAVLETVA